MYSTKIWDPALDKEIEQATRVGDHLRVKRLLAIPVLPELKLYYRKVFLHALEDVFFSPPLVLPRERIECEPPRYA